MSKKNERGFTLIELFVIGVIICILSTFVAISYSGVQVQNRNAQRQASLDNLKSVLETYYAEDSRYPSLTQLNNPTWRNQNMKDLNQGDLQDPQWSSKVSSCTVNGQVTLASKPTAKCYSYQATTAEGTSCLSAKATCGQYTLTAILEGGQKYVKSSLN